MVQAENRINDGETVEDGDNQFSLFVLNGRDIEPEDETDGKNKNDGQAIPLHTQQSSPPVAANTTHLPFERRPSQGSDEELFPEKVLVPCLRTAKLKFRFRQF